MMHCAGPFLNRTPTFDSVNAGNMVSTGNMSANGMSITGNMVSGNASIGGLLTSATANVAGNLTAGGFSSGGSNGITANLVIPAVATLQIKAGIIVSIV